MRLTNLTPALFVHLRAGSGKCVFDPDPHYTNGLITMMPFTPFLCIWLYENSIGWFSYILVVMDSIGKCVNSLAIPRDCDVTFLIGSKLVHRFRVNWHTSTCFIFCSGFNEACCMIVDIHDIHVHAEQLELSVKTLCGTCDEKRHAIKTVVWKLYFHVKTWHNLHLNQCKSTWFIFFYKSHC